MARYGFIRTLGVGLTILWAAGAVAATVEVHRQSTGQEQRVTSPAPGKPGGAVQPKAHPSIIQLLQKGGPVMFPLYLCSILTVAFAIERAVSLRRRKISPQQTSNLLRSAMANMSRDFDSRGLLNNLEADSNPLARIAAAGIRRTGRSIMEVEKAIEDAAAKEINKMQRNNRVLSGVASVSPLLGLLGTATGIIRTFMTVAATEEALGRTELLAGGIYEALVATAVGLTIAIVALVLYLFFQERVDRLVSDIDDLVTELAGRLASDSRAEKTP